MDRLVADRRALDEPRDEIALRADERGHLGSDPDTGGGHRRRMLDLAADAEQVRVVAGEPDHVPIHDAVHGHEEVAVRDATRQGRQVEPAHRPAPGHAAARSRGGRAVRLARTRPQSTRGASVNATPGRMGDHHGRPSMPEPADPRISSQDPGPDRCPHLRHRSPGAGRPQGSRWRRRSGSGRSSSRRRARSASRRPPARMA